MDDNKSQTVQQNVLKKPAVLCPWLTTNQTYSPTINMNTEKSNVNLNNSNINNQWSNNSGTVPIDDTSKLQCDSMQQSSSQFFYFLRLMELFPDTHPATLHTVLTLCKNNFFCAVDKLLYAKRCKVLYNRRQQIFQRFSQNRAHPYCKVNNKNASNTIQRQANYPSTTVKNNLELPNKVKTATLNEKITTKTFETIEVRAEGTIEEEAEMSTISDLQAKCKLPSELLPVEDDSEETPSPSVAVNVKSEQAK